MKCLTVAEADMMRERASSPTRHPETHTHCVFFIYGLLQVATSGVLLLGTHKIWEFVIVMKSMFLEETTLVFSKQKYHQLIN